jgi:hypothetical protein
MATTPEELALDLSHASVRAQEQSANQLREKATTVLSAASVVVPVVAVAVGNGPTVAAVPFGVAALAYLQCVRECGRALFPGGVHVGLLGSDLLDTAKARDADLRQMLAAAATYLDDGYKHNQAILEDASRRLEQAIYLLTAEIVALLFVLVITIIS